MDEYILTMLLRLSKTFSLGFITEFWLQLSPLLLLLHVANCFVLQLTSELDSTLESFSTTIICFFLLVTWFPVTQKNIIFKNYLSPL